MCKIVSKPHSKSNYVLHDQWPVYIHKFLHLFINKLLMNICFEYLLHLEHFDASVQFTCITWGTPCSCAVFPRPSVAADCNPVPVKTGWPKIHASVANMSIFADTGYSNRIMNGAFGNIVLCHVS